MRERYETLTMAVLKDIVKSFGVKGYSTMSKDQLIDIMVEREEEERKAKEAEQNASKPKSSNAEKADKSVKVRKTDKPENTEKSDKNVKTEKTDKAETVSKNEVVETAVNEDGEEVVTKKIFGPPGFEQEYDPRLDSHIPVNGILEIIADGYGFVRCKNYLGGDDDVYISPGQIRKFGLRTGDILKGNRKIKCDKDKFPPILFIESVNDLPPEKVANRPRFEEMTPIFPNEKIKLDQRSQCPVAMRIVDLVSPVGKGQRGMIVSQPKAGKTTLLKDIAKSVLAFDKNMKMIILLIDERPEEVTDIKEAIKGENVEVIYSTFDETPEHHKKVAEMVIERARRLVESKMDVIILLDSITRLTRAYNQVIPPSGRTLSGGLDPAALHMPKKFFGAARNMREGGSLTILATALVDTGSKMDDVVYEEFKGTGNMELVLDRKLSEKRVFPAIDIVKSGTRNEHLLLTEDELNAITIMRKGFNGIKTEEAVDRIIELFSKTKNNDEFVNNILKQKMY